MTKKYFLSILAISVVLIAGFLAASPMALANDEETIIKADGLVTDMQWGGVVVGESGCNFGESAGDATITGQWKVEANLDTDAVYFLIDAKCNVDGFDKDDNVLDYELGIKVESKGGTDIDYTGGVLTISGLDMTSNAVGPSSEKIAELCGVVTVDASDDSGTMALNIALVGGDPACGPTNTVNTEGNIEKFEIEYSK